MSEWKKWLINFSLVMGAVISAEAAHYFDISPVVIGVLFLIFSLALVVWTASSFRKKVNTDT